jgi:hypothetical protein
MMNKTKTKKKAAKPENEEEDYDQEEEEHKSEEEDDPDRSFDSVKSKRGRPKIPEHWSRVISLSNDDLNALQIYKLAPDLLLSSAVTASLSRGKIAPEWKPVFWPEDYVKEKHDMTIEGNKLSTSQLEKLGKKVSQCRAQ